jgi:hypothetical protein
MKKVISFGTTPTGRQSWQNKVQKSPLFPKHELSWPLLRFLIKLLAATNRFISILDHFLTSEILAPKTSARISLAAWSSREVVRRKVPLNY